MNGCIRVNEKLPCQKLMNTVTSHFTHCLSHFLLLIFWFNHRDFTFPPFKLPTSHSQVVIEHLGTDVRDLPPLLFPDLQSEQLQLPQSPSLLSSAQWGFLCFLTHHSSLHCFSKTAPVQELRCCGAHLGVLLLLGVCFSSCQCLKSLYFFL